MLPEQIPGTLFILIMATLAVILGDTSGHWALFLLGLGCVAGWQTFHPHPFVKAWALAWALGLWTLATLILFTELLS